MANDIEMTNGKPAKAAARLCNFQTGKFTLLDSHQKWLDQTIVPILRTQPETWIELVGYASRRGEFQLNDYLSFERCEAVKRSLDDYNVIFQTEWKGESESGVNERDNDGYWRAAEIYVLHNAPVSTPQPPPPVKPPSVNRLFHRSFLKHKAEANKLGVSGPATASREIQQEAIQEAVKVFVGFGTDLIGNSSNNLSNREGEWGTERISDRKFMPYSTDDRVNKVTIYIEYKYDTLPYAGGNIGVTTTSIDYEWGPPMAYVEINRKYKNSIDKRVISEYSRNPERVIRERGESMPYIVPPDPFAECF